MFAILFVHLLSGHVQNGLIIKTDNAVDFLVVIEFEFGCWAKQMDVDAHILGNFVDRLSTDQFYLKSTNYFYVIASFMGFEFKKNIVIARDLLTGLDECCNTSDRMAMIVR